MILLNKGFYVSDMLPHLADWVLLLLQSEQVGLMSGLTPKIMRAYLLGRPKRPANVPATDVPAGGRAWPGTTRSRACVWTCVEDQHSLPSFCHHYHIAHRRKYSGVAWVDMG